MMQVTVNGETRAVAAGTTVSALLTSLGLHPRLVVVEHNREILDRSLLEATEIQEGDNLELVHFVGGG
jgi:thiamine biosynthesis protein ThiS